MIQGIIGREGTILGRSQPQAESRYDHDDYT